MVSMALQLSRLPEMSLPELRQKWTEVFRSESPHPHNRTFMIQRIAHEVQLRRYGGLDEKAFRRLAEYVDEAPPRHGVQVLPGTVFVRRWGNEEHRVTALARGFEYKEVRYKSLTEVARVITGTHWSGPLFFGLTRHAAKRKGGWR